jgi:hypothetical protein
LNSPIPSGDLSFRHYLSGEPMCDQCQRIQKQISRYRGFLNQRFDVITEERIRELIADLQGEIEATPCEAPSFT